MKFSRSNKSTNIRVKQKSKKKAPKSLEAGHSTPTPEVSVFKSKHDQNKNKEY